MSKTIGKLKKLIREVINLIIRFVKPYRMVDEIFTIPDNLRRIGLKVSIMQFSMTVIGLVFAFMLKLTNMLIQYRLILLGIIVFMLYRGQDVIREGFNLYKDSDSKQFQEIFKDEIVLKGSKIIGKTAGKVMKYNPQAKIYKSLDNESMLNSINQYLQNLWNYQIQNTFNILEMVSIIIMLIVAVITNTAISQIIFIPGIIIFAFISFISSAFIALNREEYYENHRKYDNQQSVIVNDLLRVPTIVKKDLSMRIDKFKDTVTASNENVQHFHQKLNYSRLLITVIETLSQYGIIVFCLLGINWNTINLDTITEITATLVVVETALQQIGKITRILNDHNERIMILEREEEDISLILSVYHQEEKNECDAKRVEDIKIRPFSIQYIEESENDKPFSLISNNEIIIRKGDVVVLYGPSGSGKSTFMKMLTQRVSLEKSTDIPATSRFLFYDENLRFGSLNIFEELFCSSEPDLAKMKEILQNLHLWSEIQANCCNVWQWMKEKNYSKSLSNGQKQRLILAKMLYWLDNDIDVLVLDECTSGLDDKVQTDGADAEKILEYIVEYANMDKKRTIVLATHQNINGFKDKLKNKFVFKNIKFVKERQTNIIREIPN